MTHTAQSPYTQSHHSPYTARLRGVLTANAVFSTISGFAAALFAPALSEELGIDHVLLTRLLGAGLIAFAGLVLAIARSSERRMLAESLAVSLGDFGWVAATIVVLATGVLTTTGAIAAVAIALVVADFGASQLWFRARAQADTPSVQPAPA